MVVAEASAAVAEAADGDPTSGSSTTSLFSAISITATAITALVTSGSEKLYVGVMTPEVLRVIPQAVARGGDGYLIVHYERHGLKLESYDQIIKSGLRVPISLEFSADYLECSERARLIDYCFCKMRRQCAAQTVFYWTAPKATAVALEIGRGFWQ